MEALRDPWLWVFLWSMLVVLAAVCLAPLLLVAMMLWKSYHRRAAWRVVRGEAEATPESVARQLARFRRSSYPGDSELVAKLSELQRTLTP